MSIVTVITTAKKQDLHPEIRKAGVHVQEVIKRLASCAPLNVTDTTGHDRAVVEQAIDLTMPFLEPQLLYFHLSATLSPSGAPEIGRLINYMLLAASTQTERKHQVYLVIDEFQRMVTIRFAVLCKSREEKGTPSTAAFQSSSNRTITFQKRNIADVARCHGRLSRACCRLAVERQRQRRNR